MANILISSNLYSIVPDYFPFGKMTFGPKAHVLLSRGYQNLTGYLASFDLSVLKNSPTLFSKCVFYKINRPFNFGVVHEYWGVKLHLKRDSDVNSVPSEINMVVGLTSQSDLDFFNCSLNVLNGTVAHSPYSITIEHYQEFIEITESIQGLITRCSYTKWPVYVAAMLFTPIFGQPCSNLADSIEYILRPYVVDENQFPFWN